MRSTIGFISFSGLPKPGCAECWLAVNKRRTSRLATALKAVGFKLISLDDEQELFGVQRTFFSVTSP